MPQPRGCHRQSGAALLRLEVFPAGSLRRGVAGRRQRAVPHHHPPPALRGAAGPRRPQLRLSQQGAADLRRLLLRGEVGRLGGRSGGDGGGTPALVTQAQSVRQGMRRGGFPVISGGSCTLQWSDGAGFGCSVHPLMELVPHFGVFWVLGACWRSQSHCWAGRGGLIQPPQQAAQAPRSPALVHLPAAARTLAGASAREGQALTSVTNEVSPSQLIKQR